ncbi:neuron navigator 2 isoform X1 [Homo sapiens]|uniref:neuron navigator 2 isoform X1 n=1 Tax=Homo sapiens TaxID=9606 RepID=UPI0001EE266C|nr:neuron navigator 2 isoform X1 [Homo sapiens]|eukprot:XP_011518746.1 neuron navigator 2 isoform X1 [Homo sapiens]
MPAILVASKMKSGLPKPVHSAAPILHVPPARAGPQPCYLKLGSKVEVSKTTYPSQIPLKSQVLQGLQEPAGEGLPLRKSGSVENGFDTQIYTDWANHYLAKSGHKRLIRDLQQDVTDGVLLAQIIQVVANEKIEDINGCPKNRSQMIENIDACLNFLAAKGINIQGLSAEEIRNGNLKAILGLFFSLSRYKQQQQQPQKQHLSSPLPPAVSQVAGAPSQCQAGTPQQQVPVTPQAPCQPHQPAPHQQSKAQAEMQSSASSKDSSQSKIIRFTLGQKKISRLPGPTARVSAAGSEAKTRGGSTTANNRRSQSFNNYDKSKPVTSPPPPPSSHEKEPLASSASSHPGMSDNAPASLESGSSSTPTNCSTSSAIPQPGAATKPWRSKSLSVKHSATVSMLSVKPPGPEAPRPTPEAMKPAPNNQKSMLEKLKLFNSKGGSKAGEGPGSRDTSCERLETLPSFEESEELEAASRMLTTVGPASSSPKIALKGIAQRTFSRALTNKKSSLKGNEKEKEKQQREKDKEKSKDLAKRASVTERLDLKEEPKEDPSGAAVPEMPKKSSKIASFIPKGGKLNSAKKEPMAPSHSGIPKPGMKSMPGKSPSAPAPSKEGERSRSGKLSSGLPQQKPQLDGRHSSSSSSLASSEGKGPGGTTLNHSISSQTVSGSVGTTQTTGSNTVSVQLPQPQQQYNHPNTATVAPFLYRSQTDTEGNVTAESSSTGVSVEPSHFTKTGQPALEELTGEDPEARRLRTVKNIADLRQNLEETMSSLRGTQVTHSTLETTFDTNVTTEMSGRSILSLTGRPTPLSWRLGQSSPRLQAGDAPSMGNGYPPRANASRFINTESGRYVYSAPLRRQLASRGSSVCHVDVSDKAGDEMDLEGISMDAPGYMSDGDVLSKNIRTDDITSGYMTDGGLGLYTRRLNRLPDGMAVVRETLQRNTSLGLGDADSWDDSSSVSSGISDTIDNLSTDDINTSSSISSYANTPASSRKNLDVQTDAEKHSQVERNSLWSGDDVKKSDGGSDSGIKMEPGSKWRRNPSDVSDESDKSTSGKKNPVISQTGSWRRGMTAQVGITMPRTKPSAPAGALKTPGTGKTDDAKVSEKGRLSPKASQVKRSPSDAGRSSGDESKKPLPSSSRTPTANANSFGFKKQSGSAAGLAMITASGVTVTSRSATLGKIPKSSALVSRSAGRKSSMDGAQNQDDGYLALSSRTNLQYRSLPRPSKSNSRNGAGNRSSTSSIDSNISSKSAGLPVPKLREPSKTALGSSLPGLVNQTDKEKGISSDNESVASCNSVKVNPAAQPVSSPAQTSLQPGAKYPDVASPTLRRLFGGKPTKQVPIATAENMKNSVVISNPHATMTQQGNLDSPSGSGVLSSGSSSPLYSKNVDLNQSPLASSPSSAHSAPSNSLTWGTNASSSSAVSKDGLGFQSVSSLHTSCESIDISLSSGGVPSHNSSTGLIASSKDDSLTPFVRTNSVKTTLSESPLSSPAASPKFCRSTLPRKQDSDPHLDRNTLPKKGLRYTPTSQLRTQEDAKEWLRSHSAGGLQDTAANSPFSSGSSVTSPSGTRFNFSQLASPTTVTQMSLSNPTMLRTHSLSNADGQYDPYTDSRFRNSSMSLDEKSRTMSRSGSFRDGFEEESWEKSSVDNFVSRLHSSLHFSLPLFHHARYELVHGSSLSLVSSTSSVYSTPEEKCQSEIRKLRRELDASQEKVSALTTQLTANAHLVAAFEQSLGNMTIRLQSLTMTAEQKDSELNELRKTIELLKKQNAAAQAAINGVINTPELNCKGNGTAQSADLRIRRQHSSDSVSSINSATSHSSVGSNIESDSKKKKRKNWLRSSFKQAFGKKKSPKSASSHSDIEEMTDSSLPSSPKLPHNGSTGSTPLLRNSHSNSLISECMDSEAETVMQLRNELRDKEMKLTDIRLEALSSAHQLDQLREAMNRMQSEIEKLKAENDRLKSESQGSGCSRAPSQVSISASPRQSMGLSQHSLNLTESTSLDMLLDDTGECSARKEGGRHVKIVVSFQEEMKWKEDSRPHLFLIGCIGVSGKTKWDVLDGVVRRLFKEYIIHVDPVSQLGLNSDSVLGYSIGEIKRSNTSETPELLPCGYLVGENTTISVTVKGLAENSLDSLVFESLIPKPILQRYVSLLIEHRRIILSGPSGTGKTYLANRLSEYIVLREGRELTDGVIATFNVDHKSSKELRQYLSNLADQCNSENNAVDMPLVIILDNLHHVSSLGEIFNGLLNCKYHKCPYIIGTMNQATSSTPNLQLHHNFRWVLCANHTEPVKGFLGRFLRRKLMETEISGRVRNMELVKIIDWIPKVWHHLNRFLEAHSSSDVTIGPRLFLSCPIDVDGSRVWFTDLWNYSIIPYLLEAVREGLQLYGRRAPWEDPAKWVMDTYPWAASPQQHEWPPLLQLRPEDVGFDGYSMPREGSTSKQMPPSDAEGDPLMNMLMRLQEAANYSSPQSYDSDSNSNSHHDDILDSSLESTL